MAVSLAVSLANRGRTPQIGWTFKTRKIGAAFSEYEACAFAQGFFVVGDTDHKIEKTLKGLQYLFQFLCSSLDLSGCLTADSVYRSTQSANSETPDGVFRVLVRLGEA